MTVASGTHGLVRSIEFNHRRRQLLQRPRFLSKELKPIGPLKYDLFSVLYGAFSLKLISKGEFQIQPIFDDTMKQLRSSVGPILHQIC